MNNRRPETAAARGGRPAQQPGVPAVTPVHRETIYEFESAGEFAEVMANSGRGYLYSRIRNPNTDELAAVVAELEGAEAAHCFASGMAAISAGIDVLAGPGGRVVASRELYGQTYSLLRGRGDTVFVGVDDRAALAAAADGAALVVVETVSNPQLAVADIAEVAAVAHAAGARVLVDNTVATPLGCRPLDLGADLVAHSATKYLNGHSDALAGILAGSAELIAEVARRALDTGATMAPDTAWLVRRGVRTLHLRLERSAQNAAAVAAFLAAHPRVATVRYPGLASDPQHRVALPGAAQLRRNGHLRRRRRPAGGRGGDGRLPADPAGDQPGRRRVDDLAPGVDQPPAALAGRAADRRHQRRLAAAERGHRAPGRPDRRSRPRASVTSEQPRVSPWWLVAPAVLFLLNFVGGAISGGSDQSNAVYQLSLIAQTAVFDLLLVVYVVFAAWRSGGPVPATLALRRVPLWPAVRLVAVAAVD